MISDPQDFWIHVGYKDTTESGCWFWCGTYTGSGYGTIQYKGIQQAAHRLAYELVYGNFNLRLHVLHICDNPCCVNPSHLKLGTHKINMADSAKKHRNFMPNNLGARNGQAKLDQHDIFFIRKMFTFGAKLKDVADYFGISVSQAGRIRSRERWGELEKIT